MDDIVRCKDCVYFDHNFLSGKPFCGRGGPACMWSTLPDEDGGCTWGERIEEE